MAFGEAVEPFRKVIDETPRPNAVEALKELPQDKPCPLEYAADMCLMLTEGIANSEHIERCTGEVRFAELDEAQVSFSSMLLSVLVGVTVPTLCIFSPFHG